VGDERPRVDLARLAPEALVAVGGEWLLADVGRSLAVEPAQAGPVRLTMALRGKAVGRLEQPERGPGGLMPSAHPEQATHAQAADAVGLIELSIDPEYGVGVIAGKTLAPGASKPQRVRRVGLRR